MATTIKLFGIEAEVPEGHEDFRVCGAVAEFRAPLACGPLEIGGKRLIYSWMGIEALFLRDFETGDYYQRRVVDAAFKHFCDKSKALRDDDATALECFNAFQQAENWRRIGEAAEKVAKGGGE